MKHIRDERGAEAVEFALVLPILLLLLVGIMEFGYLYHQQTTLDQAARTAVRIMAISGDVEQAQSAAQNAAHPFDVGTGAIAVSPTTCPKGQKTDVTVTITYPVKKLTGLVPVPDTLTAKGVMRCGG